ncbi:MAG: biotin--[acetyl-CoA-carboxylase] ligase [Scytonema sp. PMC 1069.18]|nr:biotin--[acetyl-CoA-carboxylase] ligase [Scytonema sp. PMC 1069.18]MEC4886440.1 biotin--[acetyl-CoA-carboxylase] ligase [Scytonema sp. PMC 1070.18]
MGLNRQQLEKALHSEGQGIHIPFSLHLFETVSSTNQIVWDLLIQGKEPGCVVIATQQTAGRGQWGRQWISPTGGLYLSMGIALQLDATHSYQLTFATAWGIAQQLRNSGILVEIKWPNDLVLNERKLGGILTETKVQRGQITQAAIGVGINWANPVPETGINLEMWQTPHHQKPIPSLEALTAKVILGIESGIQCLFQEGVNILISRYLEFLTNMGKRVCVNDVAGTVVGVTQTGELRIRMETSEMESVKTPEIYFQPGTISLGYCNYG